jgi:hypothetical protein
MNGKRCENCSMRAYYDRKPDSLLGRVWKWHLSWCPGWKAYFRSLPEDQKIAVMNRYGSRES